MDEDLKIYSNISQLSKLAGWNALMVLLNTQVQERIKLLKSKETPLDEIRFLQGEIAGLELMAHIQSGTVSHVETEKLIEQLEKEEKGNE